MLTEEQISSMADEVKKKRILSSISDDIVREKISEVLKQNLKLLRFIGRERSEGYRKIIKLAREKLHKAYGVFQKEDKEKAKELLKKLGKARNDNELPAIHNDLLGLTLSTKERLSFYPELYEKIFSITEKPKSILDIGCGFNPFSYVFMNLDAVKYHAYDINEDDIEILNRYFEMMGDDLNGKAELFSFQQKREFPKADICFLFKVLDILDQKGHKRSEELIKNLKCRWIAASFSTITVSGKRMKHPYRGWLNRMLERLGMEFKVLEFENEIFYIIRKS